jgi:hypothetical protein
MYPFDADDKIDDILEREDINSDMFIEEPEWHNYSSMVLKK